jgi:hypothetical protein
MQKNQNYPPFRHIRIALLYLTFSTHHPKALVLNSANSQQSSFPKPQTPLPINKDSCLILSQRSSFLRSDAICRLARTNSAWTFRSPCRHCRPLVSACHRLTANLHASDCKHVCSAASLVSAKNQRSVLVFPNFPESNTSRFDTPGGAARDK